VRIQYREPEKIKPSLTVGDLRVGEVFLLQGGDGTLYQRIGLYVSAQRTVRPCVKLADGSVPYLDATTRVTVVEPLLLVDPSPALDPCTQTQPHAMKELTEMKTLNDYRDEAHEANSQWWHDADGQPIERNKAELLCLIHSEVSEAMEGERKSLMDDKLPHRPMAEVELADALIRILDYAGGFGYDLHGAYEEKMAYNATRHDHTHAARQAEGGKKF